MPEENKETDQKGKSLENGQKPAKKPATPGAEGGFNAFNELRKTEKRLEKTRQALRKKNAKIKELEAGQAEKPAEKEDAAEDAPATDPGPDEPGVGPAKKAAPAKKKLYYDFWS